MLVETQYVFPVAATALLLRHFFLEECRATQDFLSDPGGAVLQDARMALLTLRCAAGSKLGEAVQGHQVELLRAHERTPSAAAGCRLPGQLVQQATPPDVSLVTSCPAPRAEAACSVTFLAVEYVGADQTLGRC